MTERRMASATRLEGQRLFKIIRGTQGVGDHLVWPDYPLPQGGLPGGWVEPGAAHYDKKEGRNAPLAVTPEPAQHFEEGCSVYEVEISGTLVERGELLGARKLRLLRRIDEQELPSLQIFLQRRHKATEGHVYVGGDALVEARKSAVVRFAGTGRVLAYDEVRVTATGAGNVSAMDRASVVAQAGVDVWARDHAVVQAHERATVSASGQSVVHASDQAKIRVREKGRVFSCMQASVEAEDEAQIDAGGDVVVAASGCAQVTATGRASVSISGKARVVASEWTRVEAQGEATVQATDRVEVRAWDRAQVEAHGDAQVQASNHARVQAFDQATVVLRGGAAAELHDEAIEVRRPNAHPPGRSVLVVRAAQQQRGQDDLFALPLGSPRLVVRVTSSTARLPVGHLPCSLSALVRSITGRGFLVIEAAEHRLAIFDWVEGHLECTLERSLPADLVALDGVVVGDQIFVGGRQESGSEKRSEVLWMSTRTSPRWEPLHIPRSIRTTGKSVDALVVDGDRLIAVDNVVSPKWFLVYRLTPGDLPGLISTPRFHQWANEQTDGAALGPRWLALRSHSVTMEGSSQRVTLFDPITFTEVALTGTFHPCHGWSDSSSSVSPEEEPVRRMGDQLPARWHAIAWLDHQLLIAAGEDGLLVVDTRQLDERILARPPRLEEPRDQQGLKTVCVWKPAARSKVVDVIPVPAHRGCIFIAQRGRSREAHWWAPSGESEGDQGVPGA